MFDELENLSIIFLSMSIIVISINCAIMKEHLKELEKKVEQIENVYIIQEDTTNK